MLTVVLAQVVHVQRELALTAVISNLTGRWVLCCMTSAREATDCMADIAYLEGHQVTSTQLAVDSEIEEGQLSQAVPHL